MPCAKVMHSTDLLNVLLWLLIKTTEHFEAGMASPKWLAPLLLLIHQLEKVATSVTRKVNMHKVRSKTKYQYHSQIRQNEKLIIQVSISLGMA